MRSKTWILITVAVLCGMAAAYMTSQLVGQKPGDDTDQVAYLVALKKIEMGTLIKEPEKFFALKEVPKGKEPKFALTDFKDVKDHRLNKSVGLDQHITIEDLLDKEKDPFGANLTKGMRSFTIKVNVDSAGGGWVLPTSRVDIIAVMAQDNATVAKTLWQNVLVLAVDTLDKRPEEKNAVVGGTVSVEVTPPQAEEMAAIIKSGGELRLTLRPWGDDEKFSSMGASTKTIGVKGSRGDEDAPTDEDGTAHRPGLALSPKIPEVAPSTTPSQPPQPVKEEPKQKMFTMTIFNTSNATKVVFAADVAAMEVEKSEPDAPTKAKPGIGNGIK